MHHLNTDPEVEVSADLLEQFAAKHGGPIEVDHARLTMHWDHPNLPIRYFARVSEQQDFAGANYEVDSTSYTLPDGRTVIGRDAYEAEMVKAVFES